MLSSSFLAMAFLVSFLVCGSVSWQNHPLTDSELIETEHEPNVKCPQAAVGDSNGDLSLYVLEIDFAHEEVEKSSHIHLKDLVASDSNFSRWCLSHIREVHVGGEHFLGNLSLVEQVFDKLTNLTKVIWDYERQLSIQFIRSLETNSPSCKLYYSFPWEPDHNVDEVLLTSPNLFALKAYISYGYYDYTYPMIFVLTALYRNHNIRELDLTLTHHGCEFNWDLWALDFASYQRTISALGSLKIDGL